MMSLLPPSIAASQSLSAISDLAQQELDELRSLAGVLRIMDIDKVPDVLLPYLAWQFRVEGFSDKYPDAMQRAQIKSALEIHRRKGTRFAVDQGLASLGVTADIIEWFETEPQGTPHTFSITAWANSNLGRSDGEAVLSQALHDGVMRMIERTKPLRSTFQFNIGAKFDVGIGIGLVAQSITAAKASVTAVYKQPDCTVSVGIGTRLGAVTRVHATMEAVA